jgi:hypothetical protein
MQQLDPTKAPDAKQLQEHARALIEKYNIDPSEMLPFFGGAVLDLAKPESVETPEPEPMTLNKARSLVEHGIKATREAARLYVDEYSSVANIVQILNNNRSEVSGGPLTLSNIEQAVIREEALKRLPQAIRLR